MSRSDLPGTLPALLVGERLGALRARCIDAEVTSVLLTDLTNIRYLTGFTGSAAKLVLTPEAALLVSDGRYAGQAAAQLEASGVHECVELVIGRPAAQDAAVAALLRGQRVGLEADSISWADALQWSERLGEANVIAVSELLTPLRSVKDAGEVARIEAASTIADAALADCRSLLGERPTELEFARELDHRMLTTGAEALSFETICASGPNAALPHARPTNRRVGAGDLVIVDFGAVVDGYHSDMTRSFVIGDPSDEAASLLTAVGASQELGVRAVHAGATCAEVDAACRSHLEQAGYGDEFVHGTGHGVGLVIHEAPWVNSTSTTELVPGHVVTVEPGVYRPGLGGVRIEDTVLVTTDGARRLTVAPKDPVVDVGRATSNSRK